MNFNTLQPEMIGQILTQLSRMTGTQGLLNRADIPVIMKYASCLSCTSKGLYASVNHPFVIQIFLQSLSEKYGNPPEHFAAQWNTIGARKWLWNYITTSGDDQVYEVIQDIYELASQVLEEVKEAALHFDDSENRKRGPSRSQYDYQTQQGFLLYIHDSAPSHLATPFGKIKVFDGICFPYYSALSVSEIFIKRLNALFEGVSFGDIKNKYGTISEIPLPSHGSDKVRMISEQEVKEINKQEVKRRRGTQNLIVDSLCGNYSLYKIQQVRGNVLPDVIWHESRKFSRKAVLVKTIWKMLESNRLGEDPIPKKVRKEKTVLPSHEIAIPSFKNLGEVSEWGISLVKKLTEQPLFQGKYEGACDTPVKVLVLNNYKEADALQLLNYETRTFLTEKTEWDINSFGSGGYRMFLNKKDIGPGLALYSYDNYKPCDLNTLKKAYELVVKSISLHWVKSSLKDHPHILHTKSEEEYVLFIKKENILPQEGILLGYLADQLGISQLISCNNQWKNRVSDQGAMPIYLWIRKDQLEKVMEVLQISVINDDTP